MQAMRDLGTDTATYQTYRPFIESDDPEVVGNIMVCLCKQACFLLDQQIRELERAFLQEGGIRERMTRARLEVRAQQEQEAEAEAETPFCPLCSRPMRRRTAGRGLNAGRPFWGCSGYPQCRGTRPA
jgi:four helix bundle suffix protein